jgi:CheY-like chemotaxis protein
MPLEGKGDGTLYMRRCAWHLQAPTPLGEPVSSSNPSNPKSTPGPNSKLRVLVVDDEDAVRQAIAGLLRARGFDSVTAGSGDEALEKLRTEYFDVMVCDVRMPGMSGLEVLSQALMIERGLPVLMLTAANDLETARDALERGAMDYLTKPIEMEDLTSAVNSAAEHRRYELKRVSGPQPTIPQMSSGAQEVELVGGPLDARRVRVEDARYRLWVIMQPDGEHVWASMDPPSNLPEGTRAIGFYSFSPEHQTMRWTADTL